MIFARPKYLQDATQVCNQRVFGTPAADHAILRLRARHGHLTLHHTGGQIGTVDTHHPHRPLHASRHEACIGIVGGAPFFVDYDEDAELGYPDFIVEAAAPSAGEEDDGPRLVSRAIARGTDCP